MRVNQAGQPIREQVLSVYDNIDRAGLNEVVFALLEHLGLEAVRTNATKHGDTQTVVRVIGK